MTQPIRDTDRDALLKRAHRIAGEATNLASEAIKVRDQFAGMVDRLREDLANAARTQTQLEATWRFERTELCDRISVLELALAAANPPAAPQAVCECCRAKVATP